MLPPHNTNTHTHTRHTRQALRVSSYLSLITLDGLLFCGGSATWRCSVHANEPLPACVRAYGQGSWGEDGETRVGRPEPGLFSLLLTMRQREVGKAGGEGGWSSEREAQLWLVFSIYFCPPLLVSGFPSPHRLGRCEVFSPLCCYQEIIICCSVFHTDNQHYREQQNKLPHGGVQKYTNKTSVYNILSMRLYPSCSYNCLAEHISSIIFRLCQEWKANCTRTNGSEAFWTGACCASAKSIVFATVTHSCYSKVDYFTQPLQRGVDCQIWGANAVNSPSVQVEQRKYVVMMYLNVTLEGLPLDWSEWLSIQI